MTAKEIIAKLNLLAHPEGGFYKETYRSTGTMITGTTQRRNVSTSIYYLLENNDKSHFHRIKSDELWYFHLGDTLEILVIKNDKLERIYLGNNIAAGETPQAMIPANCWFASHVKDELGFSLVSCSVAPGFDFTDFEMADREQLISSYPNLETIIKKFTKV